MDDNTWDLTAVPADVRARMNAALMTWWLAISEIGNRYGYSPFELPVLRFDLRGSDAGHAVISGDGSVIKLNRELCQHHAAHFAVEIIPHELAHVAADRWLGCGVDSHGYQWRWVMAQIGKEPAPFHCLPVPRPTVNSVECFAVP